MTPQIVLLITSYLDTLDSSLDEYALISSYLYYFKLDKINLPLFNYTQLSIFTSIYLIPIRSIEYRSEDYSNFNFDLIINKKFKQ